jgi:hypothetical protein
MRVDEWILGINEDDPDPKRFPDTVERSHGACQIHMENTESGYAIRGWNVNLCFFSERLWLASVGAGSYGCCAVGLWTRCG